MSEKYSVYFDGTNGRNFIKRETFSDEILRETWYMSDDEIADRLNTLTAERETLKALCVKASRVLVNVVMTRKPEEVSELFNEINRTLLKMETK